FTFFFSSRRRHTRFSRDWSSDVCSSDLRQGAFERDARSASGYANERAENDCRKRKTQPGQHWYAQGLGAAGSRRYEFTRAARLADRKSVVYGKSVDGGGGRSEEKKNEK